MVIIFGRMSALNTIPTSGANQGITIRAIWKLIGKWNEGGGGVLELSLIDRAEDSRILRKWRLYGSPELTMHLASL